VRGIRVDEQTAVAQLRLNVEELAALRDKLHQGYMPPVGDMFTDFVLGCQLLGLRAQNYQPDLPTLTSAPDLGYVRASAR